MKSLTVQTSAVSLIYRPNPKIMVLATPPVHEIVTVDQWFRFQAEALKLLAPLPDLSTVKQAFEQHLQSRVQRLSRHVIEPEDSASWLKMILKSGEIIRLWPSPEQAVTIAVNCSSNSRLAQEQLSLIQSPEFHAVRQALGINKHWFLIIPGYPLQKPKQSELLDALYKYVAYEEECVLFQL